VKRRVKRKGVLLKPVPQVIMAGLINVTFDRGGVSFCHPCRGIRTIIIPDASQILRAVLDTPRPKRLSLGESGPPCHPRQTKPAGIPRR
jgi:hypothetical protein